MYSSTVETNEHILNNDLYTALLMSKAHRLVNIAITEDLPAVKEFEDNLEG